MKADVVGIFDATKDGKPYVSKNGKPEYAIGIIVEDEEDFQRIYIEKDEVYQLLAKYGCIDIFSLMGKEIDVKRWEKEDVVRYYIE